MKLPIVGMTLESWENRNDDFLILRFKEGVVLKMFHTQDCCEDVYIDDINGDLDALVGSKIVTAYITSDDGGDGYGEYLEWTFYHLRSHAGDVCITWKGSSNGYYSTAVDEELLVPVKILTP